MPLQIVISMFRKVPIWFIHIPKCCFVTIRYISIFKKRILVTGRINHLEEKTDYDRNIFFRPPFYKRVNSRGTTCIKY